MTQTTTLDQPQMSLGEVVIAKEAFELDLKINEGYQAYSQELLRLALLAIAGVSTIWLKLYLDPSQKAHPSIHLEITLLCVFTLLIISAGCSLTHRYLAFDSLACHLIALRRKVRLRPE